MNKKSKKVHPCRVPAKNIFGQKTGGFELEHKWGYYSKERRKCVNCNQEQIYFGMCSSLEDWRNAI